MTDQNGAEHPGVGPDAPLPEASDAALPGTADAEGWRRLHPLSPLLRGGLVLLVIAGIIVANFRDRFVEVLFISGILRDDDRVDIDVSGEGDIIDLVDYLVEEGLALVALGVAATAILLIVFFSWIAWRFSTYRITPEAVEARRGVLFRSHRRAPLERIQSVNLQRSLLARALGLTKIDVLTAGQGGKVELAFLGHRDAKLVREQIIRRAAAKRGEPRIAAPAAVDFAGRAYGEASGRLAQRAQDFADADIAPEAAETHALVRVPVGRLAGSIALSWESVVTVLILVGIIVGGAVLEPALILGVIPMLIVMVGITFSQFNKGFNFVLSRGRDSVRTGSGLTATATESVPFGRIHAVEARQPLLWRPLGWWKMRITTAGHSVAQGGQNSTQNVVLPVGVEADVLRVFETLLPGLGDDERDLAELRDGLSGRAREYLGAGPRAGWVLWWGRRRAGVTIADADTQNATMRVRRGALTRSLSIMPIVRAQSVQLRRPMVHRMLGLASVQAHTVLGPVRIEMRGIELGAAQGLFDRLAAVVLRVQMADAPGVDAPDAGAPGAAAPDEGSRDAGAPDAGGQVAGARDPGAAAAGASWAEPSGAEPSGAEPSGAEPSRAPRPERGETAP